MKCNIGTSIRYLREKRGVPQSVLYDGLCSQASFSRIESGEKEMDQLLLYALLSRLGISVNKYTLILNKKDIALMEKRKEIEEALQGQSIKEAKAKLEQYEKNDFTGLTKKLHDQYINFIKAKLYNIEGEWERAKEQLAIGIRRTNRHLLGFIKGKTGRAIAYISEMELMQVCMYCEILDKEGEEGAREIWRWIYHYIENYIEDTEYKIKFYPICSYRIACAYQKEGNWMECLSYCNQAIEFLKKYKNLVFLKEFLELYQVASRKMGIEPKRENIDYLSMLNFIEENLLYSQKVEVRARSGVYFIGDIIKNTREYVGVTQEQLNYVEKDGKGKADPSTLSHIENGHRTPRKTTSDYYFQKLGLGQYQMEIAPIVGEDFELQELRWKLDYMLSGFQFDHAKTLCKQIEDKIDMSIVQNQQYINRVKTVLAYYQKEITLEEYREQLTEVLRMTWSDYDVGDTRSITRFLTKTEESLFINIAQTYKNEQKYEIAIRLYRKLKEYFEDIYSTSGYTSYILLCYSLEQALGLSNRYWEGIGMATKGIQLEYVHRDMQVLNNHLYNIGWNYGKLLLESNDEKEKEKYKKACQLYLEQALKGAVFMENTEIVNAINQKINLFHIKI